jgi:hypothetical protein
MDTQNASTRAFNSSRSLATAAVDNVIRRALKVADPNNADEVAKGLLARYPDDAARIKREQLGLPFSVFRAQQPAPRPYQGRREMDGASAALESALTDLTTNPKLIDVRPEMSGWSTTIRRAAADGVNSASIAIDPSERNRAFGSRRELGEYGRLARYVGALTACAPDIFCRVARACDDIANIILVMMGDALGDAGLSRGGAVIRVPGALLRSRRDAVIAALLNLIQPSAAGSEEDWPRGPLALSQLYDGFEDAGSPELLSLLEESYLSRELDALVDMASGSTSDGLRALGASAAPLMQKLQRFLILGQSVVNPPSPPATMFFTELQLFIQGFANTNAGYRLPYLAQSPLLVSAYAASAGIDAPTQTLLKIALSRTAFADALDCLCCLCSENDAQDLIVAGKVLFDIDRAIDLYALGTDPKAQGGAEWRAAIYGAVINGVVVPAGGSPPPPAPGYTFKNTTLLAQNALLDSIVKNLQWPSIVGSGTPPVSPSQLAAIINMQIDDELRWGEIASTVAPLCRQDLVLRQFDTTTLGTTAQAPPPANPIGALLWNAALAVIGTTPPITTRDNIGDKKPAFDVPPTMASSLAELTKS